jgi:hypothetical protein
MKEILENLGPNLNVAYAADQYRPLHQIAHTPLENTADPFGLYQVTANIIPYCVRLDTINLFVHFNTIGVAPFDSLPLTPTENNGEFAASDPGWEWGMPLSGPDSAYPGVKVWATNLDGNLNLPSQYSLSQNYPNQFNANTTFIFSLPEEESVILKIYNIVGQEIISLIDEVKPAGKHVVNWNGKDVSGLPISSGIYLYQIKIGNFEKTKKMVFIR